MAVTGGGTTTKGATEGEARGMDETEGREGRGGKGVASREGNRGGRRDMGRQDKETGERGEGRGAYCTVYPVVGLCTVLYVLLRLETGLLESRDSER